MNNGQGFVSGREEAAPPIPQNGTSPQIGLPVRSGLQDVAFREDPAVAPQIEGYQIINRLGTGGMGSVWRAWQLSTKREVALKFLNLAASSSEKARRRFDREVEATSRLQHSHIARIHDSGLQHGVYFYAMELIEGQPLDRYVNENHLSVPDILELMCVISKAVQYAHQRGVIHRDLKPSNIIVNIAGEPHVLDFGLAKIFEANNADSVVSVDGEISGTPAFMSPEQAAGKFDQLDTRTDVYSLGVVLFRLLTGRYPHDITGANWEVTRRIAEEEVVRPRMANRGLHPELESILLKALARDPEHRYSSVGAFAQDIHYYLAGEPVTAQPPTRLYHFRKWLFKHRAPVVGVSTLALSASGLLLYSSISIKLARDRAVAQRDRAEEIVKEEKLLRRHEEILTADSLVPYGDILVGRGEFHDARRKYADARSRYCDNGISPLVADLCLYMALEKSPPLLCRINSSDVARAVFAPDGARLLFSRHNSAENVICEWSPGVGTQRVLSTSPRSDNSIVAFGAPSQVVRYERKAEARSGAYTVLNLETGKTTALMDSIDCPLDSTLTVSSRGEFLVYVSKKRPLSEIQSDDIVPVVQSRELMRVIIQPMRTGAVPVTLTEISDASSPVIGLGSFETRIAMLTGSGERQLKIWDSKTHVLQRSIELNPASTTFACSPVEDIAWVGQSDGSIAALDLKSGITVRRLESSDHTGITNLSISPDGHTGVFANSLGALELWDTTTGQTIGGYETESNSIRSIGFSPSGDTVILVDRDGIRLWKVRKEPARRFSRPTHALSMAISPDAREALVGNADATTYLIDIATHRPLQRFRCETTEVIAVAFGKSNDAFTFHRNGCTEQWDLASGNRIACWDHAPIPVISTAANLSATKAIVVLPHPLLLDLRTGARRPLECSTSALGTCGFSANGEDAFIVDMNAKIHLYDGQTGRYRGAIPAPEKLTAAAMSADGRLILGGDESGRVSLMTSAGILRWTYQGHAGSITCAIFSPDGTVAITGGEDGAIRLWNVESGKQLRVLADNRHPVKQLVYTSDGSYLGICRRREADVQFLDFSTGVRQNFEEATCTLPQSPLPPGGNDLEIGNWFLSCERYAWAKSRFEKARAAGYPVPPISLGRVYWQLDEYDKAMAEFRRPIEENPKQDSVEYLRICLNAIQREAKESIVHAAGTVP